MQHFPWSELEGLEEAHFRGPGVSWEHHFLSSVGSGARGQHRVWAPRPQKEQSCASAGTLKKAGSPAASAVTPDHVTPSPCARPAFVVFCVAPGPAPAVSQRHRSLLRGHLRPALATGWEPVSPAPALLPAPPRALTHAALPAAWPGLSCVLDSLETVLYPDPRELAPPVTVPRGGGRAQPPCCENVPAGRAPLVSARCTVPSCPLSGPRCPAGALGAPLGPS